MNRPLSASETHLVRWMLEHGNAEAKDYLTQLEDATVTPWRCDCGCASLQFAIRGRELPRGGLRLLADFLFGPSKLPSGVFVYAQEGTLSGVEVYGLGGEAPKVLPTIDALRPMSEGASSGS